MNEIHTIALAKRFRLKHQAPYTSDLRRALLVAVELYDALAVCHSGISYINPQLDSHRRHNDQLSRIGDLLKNYAGDG